MLALRAHGPGTGAAGTLLGRAHRGQATGRPCDDSPSEDLVSALFREVARSRRYGHELTLIGIVPADGARPDDAADEVRRCIRAVDAVWVSRDGIIVLLPESGCAEGRALAGRMRDEVPLLADASMRVAGFPADALTTTALLEITCGRRAPSLAEPPAVPQSAHLGLVAARSSVPTATQP